MVIKTGIAPNGLINVKNEVKQSNPNVNISILFYSEEAESAFFFQCGKITFFLLFFINTRCYFFSYSGYKSTINTYFLGNMKPESAGINYLFS